MDWLNEQIQLNISQQLNQIKNRAKEILKESINKEIYSRYIPNEHMGYIRTYQLPNAVNIEIKGDSLIVFVDGDLLNYKSAVDDRNVSIAVPKFLRGHNDNSGIYNWYHHYPKSNYLETAKQMIESELGLKCEIIDDPPPIV